MLHILPEEELIKFGDHLQGQKVFHNFDLALSEDDDEVADESDKECDRNLEKAGHEGVAPAHELPLVVEGELHLGHAHLERASQHHVHADPSHEARERHAKARHALGDIFHLLKHSVSQNENTKDCLEDESCHGLGHQVDHVFLLAEFQLLNFIAMFFNVLLPFSFIVRQIFGFFAFLLHLFMIVKVLGVQRRNEKHRVDTAS